MIYRGAVLFKKPGIGLLFFVFFVFVIGGGRYASARIYPILGQWVFVRWVVDGDTFFITDGRRVRLKGIDAPEISHQLGEPSQYYAREAKRFLISLIWKKKVILARSGREKDRFNRIVAYVYLPDGRFINLLMLKMGCAFYFPHKGQVPQMRKLFLRAQRTAMREGVGFWKRILSLPSAQQRFIGSKKSLRFHTINCVLGRNISPRNRIIFPSLYKAFFKGYAPCRICTIWPLVDE